MSSFLRLNITVEGQTEEKFVRNSLSKHLGSFQISTTVRRVRTSKDKYKIYRGGLISYQKAKFDIKTWLKEDKKKDVRFSTMFDLYALPEDFPGFREAKEIADIYEKVHYIETKFKDDIDDYRFIPYIQLHEFEALVLANPENLSFEYFQHDNAIRELKKLLQSNNDNPEAINDKIAPSKTIMKLIPEYDKVNAGAFIAAINGLHFLRDKCKHFGDWVENLEELK